MVDVVQLVRASDCGSECRGFESHHPPFKNKAEVFNDLRFFLLYHYLPKTTWNIARQTTIRS